MTIWRTDFSPHLKETALGQHGDLVMARLMRGQHLRPEFSSDDLLLHAIGSQELFAGHRANREDTVDGARLDGKGDRGVSLPAETSRLQLHSGIIIPAQSEIWPA